MCSIRRPREHNNAVRFTTFFFPSSLKNFLTHVFHCVTRRQIGGGFWFLHSLHLIFFDKFSIVCVLVIIREADCGGGGVCLDHPSVSLIGCKFATGNENP